MSMLLPNRFELSPDGWYQVSALGEFKHNPTGLVQILDADSCKAMIEAFQHEAQTPNFPGILVDFDHFSLDQDKPTEAAGWIAALEQRPDGLWAQIRWTDKGEEAIRGGRYRFISPVFRQDECTDLGESRVRPLRLVNAALTNDPNISGMVPLSNKKLEKPAAAAEGVATAPMLIRLGSRDRALFNRAMHLANWGGSPLTDEQRRAMFARLRGGGGGGGGGGGAGGDWGAYQGSVSYRPPDYSSARDSEARIAVLEQQRNNILASIPNAPEPRNFELMDTRALERSLIQSGATWSDIKAQVQAAEAHNQAVGSELRAIKQQIKAKHKDPRKQKAALQAYFDKLAEQDAKAQGNYEKIVREAQERINKLDAAIQLERVRQKEAQAETERREYNADSRELNRSDKEALKAQIAADKAEARAAAQVAKANSPEALARQEKQKVTALKTLWRDAANGDEHAIIRGLQKLGVDPSTVDIPAMVKEAVSIGVVGRDANYVQRLQARQDKANAYNRPIPGVDGEPIQLVPRSIAQYNDGQPIRGVNPGADLHNPPVSQVEVDSLRRYQSEVDAIRARNDRGAIPDWQTRQELERAWMRHQQRISGE